MRVIPAGTRALLIECDDQDQVFRLYSWLGNDSRWSEIIPADRTIMAISDFDLDLEELSHEIYATETHNTFLTPLPPAQSLLSIPVRYDGIDLHTLATQLGLTQTQLIKAHTDSPWTVQFLGFSPGFAYLVHPTLDLRVARHESPRPRIPSGAVALAAHYSAIYPSATPGGWQIIGHTDLTLWNPNQENPSLLTPGMQVQFVEHA